MSRTFAPSSDARLLDVVPPILWVENAKKVGPTYHQATAPERRRP
jgi:hypothetical protein